MVFTGLTSVLPELTSILTELTSGLVSVFGLRVVSGLALESTLTAPVFLTETSSPVPLPIAALN